MEYLILSDIHFRNKFEERKFKFLLNLISNFENIIINGDLYEARYIMPSKFLNSNYKPLLDLLRQKNTIYIFGNHDPEHKSKEVAKYVSKEQYDYFKLKVGDTYYHIEHGHRLGWKMDNTPDFVFKIIDMLSYEIQKRFDFLTRYLGNKWNKIIKTHRKLQKIISDTEYLIVGHTHVKTLELQEKFINGGYIKYGRGSYLVVSDKKTPQVIDARY